MKISMEIRFPKQSKEVISDKWIVSFSKIVSSSDCSSLLSISSHYPLSPFVSFFHIFFLQPKIHLFHSLEIISSHICSFVVQTDRTIATQNKDHEIRNTEILIRKVLSFHILEIFPSVRFCPWANEMKFEAGKIPFMWFILCNCSMLFGAETIWIKIKRKRK